MVLLLVSDQISSNADHQAIYEQLKIATGSHKQIILIKAIGYWLTNALPISMLTIGLMVGAGVPQIKLCYLSLTLLIISINYSILQVSLSALTIGLRMRELIIPVLLMPLLTPSILGGTAIIVELMQPNIDLSMINSSLTMMAGIGLIWIVSSLLILEI